MSSRILSRNSSHHSFLDIVREEGNIFQLIDAAVGYIIKNIRWRVEMEGDGIHRKEIPEIPVDAMREAVINSFAHRPGMIFLFSTKLTSSPAGLAL